MRRFRVYRPDPPENYLAGGFANPADEVQFEGVEFSDGTVAVRWLTKYRSTSFWSSFEELMKVHGHMEEYGTIIGWMDDLRTGSKRAGTLPDLQRVQDSASTVAGDTALSLRGDLRLLREARGHRHRESYDRTAERRCIRMTASGDHDILLGTHLHGEDVYAGLEVACSCGDTLWIECSTDALLALDEILAIADGHRN